MTSQPVLAVIGPVAEGKRDCSLNTHRQGKGRRRQGERWRRGRAGEEVVQERERRLQLRLPELRWSGVIPRRTRVGNEIVAVKGL